MAAYISYLAACEMNEAFSEYVLYEPLLRIMTARGFTVECEVECPGIKHAENGERKRLDFVATGHNLKIAIEVKWIKDRKPLLAPDVEKLAAFKTTHPDSYSLLCVFGRASNLGRFEPPERFEERGKALYADLGRTKYGCRFFELASPSGAHDVCDFPLASELRGRPPMG